MEEIILQPTDSNTRPHSDLLEDSGAFTAEYGVTTSHEFFEAFSQDLPIVLDKATLPTTESNSLPVSAKTYGNDWVRVTFKSKKYSYTFDSTSGWSYEALPGEDYIIPADGIPIEDLSREIAATLHAAIELPVTGRVPGYVLKIVSRPGAADPVVAWVPEDRSSCVITITDQGNNDYSASMTFAQVNTLIDSNSITVAKYSPETDKEVAMYYNSRTDTAIYFSSHEYKYASGTSNITEEVIWTAIINSDGSVAVNSYSAQVTPMPLEPVAK